MGKRCFPLAWLLFLGVAALEGCSRQDTECLSSIGRRILERASAASAGCRDRLEGLKSAKSDTTSLQDRVTLRLRWEKVLADTSIEVVASGQEIELKGTVKTAEQRTRAVELAESTTGVDRVLVSLTMGEPPSPMEKKNE